MESIKTKHRTNRLCTGTWERNFLLQSSFENLGSKSQSHQATLVLIKVYTQAQSSEKEYQKFVEILRRYNSTTADALSNPVDERINNPVTGR